MKGSTLANTKQGKIRGCIAKNFDGYEYIKFLGIPYGKPPCGDLRFKAPRLAEPWAGIRDGTQEGNMCYMSNYRLSGQKTGSEDCLYLNVYTRNLPETGTERKPVLVHFHGGAFITGSGNEDFFGTPDFLMTEDIVLVNINYRLGVLGFLSLDDPSLEVPGNAGLKDQRLALIWVQENIQSFNGDPKNVTIFGLSCGGASVHFHILSESSKGLFHKGIIQSGTVLSPWAWGSKNAIAIAKNVDASVTKEKEALEILMDIDIETLYDASRMIKDDFFMSQVRRPFGPVIEKSNPTAFLTKNPIEIMNSGTYNQVPCIIGCTSKEGLLVERDFFDFIKPPHVFNKNDGVFWYSGFEIGSSQFETIKNEIAKFNFGNEDGQNIYDFYSDIMFVSGMLQTIKLVYPTAQNPIYCYNFDANTEMCKQYLKFLGNGKLKENLKGSSHGNDYPYLFKRTNLKLDTDDVKIMRNMVQLWTTFALSGIPSIATDMEFRWEPIKDPNNLSVLNIDVDLKMINNFANDKIMFWDRYFKRYTPKFEY